MPEHVRDGNETHPLRGDYAALPVTSWADTVSGPYVSLGVGWNHLQDETVSAASLKGQATTRFNGPASFNEGFVGLGSLGWGFGNGLRTELEASYRWNTLHSVSGAGSTGGNEDKYGGMVNVLYDFDLGGPITPYIGAGVGVQSVGIRNGSLAGPGYYITLQHPQVEFAYQAMVGAALDLPVPGLSLTAEYRFLGIEGDPLIYGQYFAPGVARPASVKFSDDFNHSILIGVRYVFNTAQPAPPPPVVQPVPAPAPARTYLVFFDWDRADLTDRARQIITEAAQASTRVQYSRIEVQGNADRSGTPAYNQQLSLRRAQTVATELVRQGVPGTAIDIQAFGDTRPAGTDRRWRARTAEPPRRHNSAVTQSHIRPYANRPTREG
jgi:OmpA-OmpF porin, OOP family